MPDARTEILDRIRGALGSLRPSLVQRRYRISIDANPLDLFEDRLLDYGAGVYRCGTEEIPSAIAHIMHDRQKTSLIIPPGIPSGWLPNDFHFQAGPFDYLQLDRSEGVLTGCALAIAQTGTIVLRHSEAEGRRALTLIPDYHLCVVHAGQIVGSVVEGFRQMAKFATVPITTISGPSATSDIEMTRIKGVHGPRVLDVVLVA